MKCNVCGEALKEFKDYLYVEKHWGYHSDKDLELHEFRICLKCYDRLVKSFKVPVTVKEYNPGDLCS